MFLSLGDDVFSLEVKNDDEVFSLEKVFGNGVVSPEKQFLQVHFKGCDFIVESSESIDDLIARIQRATRFDGMIRLECTTPGGIVRLRGDLSSYKFRDNHAIEAIDTFPLGECTVRALSEISSLIGGPKKTSSWTKSIYCKLASEQFIKVFNATSSGAVSAGAASSGAASSGGGGDAGAASSGSGGGAGDAGKDSDDNDDDDDKDSKDNNDDEAETKNTKPNKHYRTIKHYRLQRSPRPRLLTACRSS